MTILYRLFVLFAIMFTVSAFLDYKYLFQIGWVGMLITGFWYVWLLKAKEKETE